MGNRAVITDKEKKIGVYLHWNGGRDSVEAFLKYCELKGFGGFNNDYGKARFSQVVGNFFGGGLSLGITTCTEECDDNGVYIVDGWEIVGREDFQGEEQHEHDLQEMLIEIDKRQPKEEQLGDYVFSKEINGNELKIGDVVFIIDYDDKMRKYKVIGFGNDKKINGCNVEGIPYINKYGDNYYDFPNNLNNYIFDRKVRIV